MRPLMLSILLFPAAGQSGSPVPPPPDTIQIDGAKRPDLVPQWSVWGYVFRILAGGSRQLPTQVQLVVSREEGAMLLKEADALQKADAACQTRLAKAVSRLGSDPTEAVDARVREITLECRREILDARDRALAALNPEGSAALAAFAESTKAGTSITMPKAKLARFLEPE